MAKGKGKAEAEAEEQGDLYLDVLVDGNELVFAEVLELKALRCGVDLELLQLQAVQV